MTNDLNCCRTRLILWGQKNFRSFPWRINRTPYSVFISEIMLHRTRAEQVLPVYITFIQRYPDLKSIVNSDPEVVKKFFSPLGLQWRAEKFYEACNIIYDDYAGEIPGSKKDLLKLPGVGQYIAGAVMCFAYGKSEPIVDTNIVRVYSRLSGSAVNDSTRRSRTFRDNLMEFAGKSDPVKFNYALLDLAYSICVPGKDVKCNICPLNKCCSYAGKSP